MSNHAVLQSTLDGIGSCCEKNEMVLNARKCKEILICFWKKNT